jgi:N-alpha-acetyltransferase 10/11
MADSTPPLGNEIELAMVETFGAHYVSLHVRVSNKAAIHLYSKTLGFDREKTEAKYYADGEDAYCMRLELSSIRDQIREQRELEYPDDEGEPVGDVGKAGEEKDLAMRTKDGNNKDAKRKVKVGRALGVQGLVEKDESSKNP